MKTLSKCSRFFAILILASALSCSSNGNKEVPETGVSLALAQKRKEQLSDIVYTLHFDIPENRETPVIASLELSFTIQKKAPVILDFKADKQQIKTLRVNESSRKIVYVNEHIIIQPKYLKAGKNQVKIDFLAGNMSLNRNEDYLYTLLVPDRARTLFPCFDQPDLKAVYTLSLTLPQTWKAVANGKIANRSQDEDGYTRIDFEPTEPLSTYLFSFVAGELQQCDYLREGRPVTIYHRETDPGKLAAYKDIWDRIPSPIQLGDLAKLYANLGAHESGHMVGLVSRDYLGGEYDDHNPANQPWLIMNYEPWLVCLLEGFRQENGKEFEMEFNDLNTCYLNWFFPKP